MIKTVNQLHKQLTKLIEKGEGRTAIAVHKDTFSHNCEGDGVTILPICGLRVDLIHVADGDGGTAVNKDGSEKYRRTAVLFGDNYDLNDPDA